MKTIIVRQREGHCIAWLMTFAILIGLTVVVTGCGSSTKESEAAAAVLFPSFKNLLAEEKIPPSEGYVSSDVVPVRIYFDNTGSMEGFTIDQDGKRNPCAAYAKLMRCLRDMGRMQTAEYYVLDLDTQDWALYEESLYENFYTKDFHVWWRSGQPGPLSKLYMDNRIDENYINIVLTDLAEQNLNNTQLAEQIQKMCLDKNCEADLFAFKFEFNGATQVPDPNAASGMLQETVHGEKPYYMIITGRSDYMEKYRAELRELMEDAGLEEGLDFFTATSKTTVSYELFSISDVIFEPFADYEQILQESEEKEKRDKAKEKGEENDIEEESENTWSKNLLQYEDTAQISPDDEFAAFYYQKVDGVSKAQGDWRLNFYMPLKDFADSQMKYSYQYHIYKLEEPATDMEEAGEENAAEMAEINQETAVGMEEWVEDINPRMEVSIEVRENFSREGENYPAVLYVSCRDKNVEKEHDPREQELLLILEISKERVYFYERPEWIAFFDTGSTDDYFTRTFNLNGFYDVLFGNKNRISGDGTIHIPSGYGQIPILVTGLKE